MLTPAGIISQWPTVSEFARDIGLRRASHGTLMKMRGRIPSEHWSAVVSAAQRRGLSGITLEALAEAHARPADTKQVAA